MLKASVLDPAGRTRERLYAMNDIVMHELGHRVLGIHQLVVQNPPKRIPDLPLKIRVKQAVVTQRTHQPELHKQLRHIQRIKRQFVSHGFPVFVSDWLHEVRLPPAAQQYPFFLV